MPAIRSQRGEDRDPCHASNRPISGKIKIGFPDEKFKDRGPQNRGIAATLMRGAAVRPSAAGLIPARASELFSG